MTDYSTVLIDFGYILASMLFIIGIKMLGRPERARQGNMVSALGMLIAVVAALFECCLSFSLVIAGVVVGALIGIIAARTVKMTSMPQMVAILNGFGGLASLLVGWENYHSSPDGNRFVIFAIVLAVLIGGVAFSGSVLAYGKLAERISGRPIFFKGQKGVNAAIIAAIVVCGVVFVWKPTAALAYPLLIVIICLALFLGALGVIPIGGADMPVVISLLNSYSGLAACAAGFAVVGYGWCGRGIALRAHGHGAHVVVTEVDPLRALEAAMDGYRVMPLLDAAREADFIVTATGDKHVVDQAHMEVMKDGCVLANSGHFNVEINIPALENMAVSKERPRVSVDEYTRSPPLSAEAAASSHVVAAGRFPLADLRARRPGLGLLPHPGRAGRPGLPDQKGQGPDPFHHRRWGGAAVRDRGAGLAPDGPRG